MTVYVDSLFLLNAILNLLLLLGSARLGGAPIVRWRCMAAAALGGLYAVGCVVPGLAWLQAMPVKLLVLAAMQVLAFGWKKSSVKQGFLFLALSLAFGGLVLVMVNVFGTGLMLLGGAAYYPVSARVLVLTAAAVYVLTRTVFAHLAEHTGGELVPVELTLGSRTARLTALRDSGNTLKDPATNRAVLVADWRIARALLPAETASELDGAQFAHPAELLERLVQREPAAKWRLIPYRAVGTNGGLLLAMRCERMRVGEKDIEGGLVAFSPTTVSDGGAYTALIGGSV